MAAWRPTGRRVVAPSNASSAAGSIDPTPRLVEVLENEADRLILAAHKKTATGVLDPDFQEAVLVAKEKIGAARAAFDAAANRGPAFQVPRYKAVRSMAIAVAQMSGPRAHGGIPGAPAVDPRVQQLAAIDPGRPDAPLDYASIFRRLRDYRPELPPGWKLPAWVTGLLVVGGVGIVTALTIRAARS